MLFLELDPSKHLQGPFRCMKILPHGQEDMTAAKIVSILLPLANAEPDAAAAA
jgi:hypothetical protein